MKKLVFITLNFTGSGTNVITISSTEYLSGLIEIIPVENVVPISNEILVNETSGNYLIWLLVACILLIIIVFSIFKILKNKN